MKSALKPALDNVDKALASLETAVELLLTDLEKDEEMPELDLSVRNEREVNRKIAVRLDQTIHRLETLLTEE